MATIMRAARRRRPDGCAAHRALGAWRGAAPSAGTPTYEQALALAARFPTIVAAFDACATARSLRAPRRPRPRRELPLYADRRGAGERHVEEPRYVSGPAGRPRHERLDLHRARHRLDRVRSLSRPSSALSARSRGRCMAARPSLVLDMLDAIGDADNIKPWIDQALDHGDQKLMGFGHRVYKTTDPRAEILREMAQQASTPEFFALAQRHRGVRAGGAAPAQAGPAALHERRVLLGRRAARGRPAGRHVPAHLRRQPRRRMDARTCWSRSSSNRLIRPQSEYVGPQGLKFVPIEQR